MIKNIYLLWGVGSESDCDSGCDSDRDRFSFFRCEIDFRFFLLLYE